MTLKDSITLAIVVAVAFVVGGIGLQYTLPIFSQPNKPQVSFGGGAVVISDNKATNFSTSTSSWCDACPVKLLDAAPERKYAKFTNPSDTGIYLFYTLTPLSLNLTRLQSGFTSATGTLTSLNGIFVPASGSHVIDAEFLYTGEVWASTTADAVKKAINITYR